MVAYNEETKRGGTLIKVDCAQGFFENIFAQVKSGDFVVVECHSVVGDVAAAFCLFLKLKGCKYVVDGMKVYFKGACVEFTSILPD